MYDVTVKTLDGRNKSFTVEDNITVKEFKDKIASEIDIPPELQRLIFQGRVLQDEKKLNDYDVSGKVVHAVARPPPSVRAQAGGTASGVDSQPQPTAARGAGGPQRSDNVLVSTFTLPSEVVDPHQIQNIVQQTLSSMGDLGRNARVSVNSMPDGSAVNVQINLGQVGPAQVVSESSHRIRLALRQLQDAENVLHSLENASETPMDLSEDDHVRPGEGGAAAAQSSTDTATSSASQSTDSGSTGSQTSGAPGQQQPQHPRTQSLADVLARLAALQARLEPHQRAYEELLRDDRPLTGEEAIVVQRRYNAISEIFHFIGHVYHHISDLILDYNRAPPRTFRALPAPHPIGLPHQAAVIQPVQVTYGVDPRAAAQVYHHHHPVSGSVSESTSTQASHVAHSMGTQTAGTVHSTAPAAEVNSRATATAAASVSTQAATATNSAETQTTQAAPGFAVNIGSHQLAPAIISVSAVTTEIVADDGDEEGPAAEGYADAHDDPYAGQADEIIVTFEGESTTNDLAPGQTATPTVPAASQGQGQSLPHTSTPTSQTGNNATPVGAQGTVNMQTLPPMQFSFNIPGMMPAMNTGAGFPSAAPAPGVAGNAGARPSTTGPTTATMPGPNMAGGPMPMPGFPMWPGFPGFPAGVQVNMHGFPPGVRPGVPQQINIPGFPPGVQVTMQGVPQGVPPGMHAIHIPVPVGAGMPPNMPPIPGLPADFMQNLVQMAMGVAQQVSPGDQGAVLVNGVPMPMPNANTATPQASPRPSVPASNPATPSTVPPAAAASTSSQIGRGSPVPQPSHHHHHHQQAGVGRGRGSVAPAGMRPNFPARHHAPPPHMPPHAFAPGGFIPGLDFPLHQADPYLPCFSRHFVSTRFAPAPRVAQQRMPAAMTPQVAHQQVMQVVNNAISSIINQIQQNGVAANSSQPSAAGQPAAAATSTAAGTQTRAGGAAAEGAGVPGAEAAATSDPTQMFTSLLQAFGSQLNGAMTGQQPQTIYDVLVALGETHTPGQGLFNDVFMCCARHLTFIDMLALFSGSRAPFERLRAPLRQFVQENMLNNAEASDANISEVADRIVQSVQPALQSAVSHVRVREGIDLVGSLSEFYDYHLTAMMHFLLEFPGSNVAFGNELNSRLRDIFCEFIALCQACLEGGIPAIEALIQHCVDMMENDATSSNPSFRQLANQSTSQLIQRFLPHVSSNPDRVQRYIVKSRDPTDGDDAGHASSDDSYVSVSSNIDHDLDDAAGAADTQTVASFEQLVELLPPAPQQHDLVPVSASADWHQAVPQEWITVISTDARRQQSMPPQAPLSDAYIAGMPAKRRKVLESQRPNVSSPADTISAAIRAAAQAVGAEPVTSLARVDADVRSDLPLVESYGEEIRRQTAERVRSDADYVSVKYPNAEKYLGSGGNGGLK